MSFSQLVGLKDRPTEYLKVQSREATIDIIILSSESQPDALRVVVQGFLGQRVGKSVALDGFHKHRDGTVRPMSASELCQFD
jgi:hypothetical protein